MYSPQPPNTAGQPFAMKNTTVYPPHPPDIAGRPFVMMNTQAVGVTGNNPGYPHNASARGIMNASHISQAIVVAGIEEEITQSGLMYELGKYAFDVSMPEDGTIVQVIERYGTTEFAFSPEQLVVYQAATDGAYGCFMVTKAGKYHKSFSFDYHPTSEMSMLYRGRKPVRKGTVFARTACVKENGGTSLSLNLITAIGSFDSVADDCVWISESAAKRMRFKMRVDSKFGCGTKTFPLNTYGDSKNYQPFAHLGEMVRDDGLLCATRDYDPSLTPILMSRDSVSSLDDYADNPTYIPMKNGRVVDIKVWRNHAVPRTMPDTMSAQFEMYYQGMRRYHEAILDLYFQLVESHRRATGYHSNYPPLRPEFTRAVYDSMMFLDRWYPIGGHTQIPQDMRAPLRLEEGKVPLDEYTVTITVEHEMEPGRGYKIAGNAGDKGVIGRITPDAEMPTDEFGNVAEIVIDAGPLVSRQIFSRPYLLYTNACSREIRRRIREMAGWTEPMSIYDVEALPPETKTAIWDQILLISRCLPGVQYETYLNLNEHDRHIVMHESLNNEVRLLMDPNRPWHTHDRVTEDGMGLVETCRLMRKYIKPPKSRVRYRNTAGDWVTTKTPIRLAPLNWMLLEKTPQEYSTAATGTVQHMGILAPPGRSEKYRYPWRDRTVRTLCEVGVRIQAGHAGATALVETLDRYNNPETQEGMVQAIHDQDRPSIAKNLVDRTRYPYNGHRAYQVWLHMMQCMGIDVRYIPPKFAVRRVNEQPHNHKEDRDV